MASNDEILSEMRRLAAANGGKPVGRDRFYRESGLTESDVVGRYWRSYGDAVEAAGFSKNSFAPESMSDDELLAAVGTLIVELGHFPTIADQRLKRRTDKFFPDTSVLSRRFGGQAGLSDRMLEFARNKSDFERIVPIVAAVVKPKTPQSVADESAETRDGYVYLIRMDRWHKIGCTKDILRRQGEIRMILPAKETLVHTIQTDDPYGVEAYWHNRFKERRQQGEWFDLSPSDIRAFKKWRRIS